LIWWRVDPALSQRLSLARYLGALVFAALAIPMVSFLLNALLSEFNPHPPNPLFYLSTAAFLGSMSIMVAGAFLLLSVPFFIIARKTGYIGLIPTLIAASILPVLKLAYEFSHTGSPSLNGQLLFLVAILCGFGSLYAITVWITCLKLHPGLFAGNPPR
jgi:hypothetical protein